MAKVKDDIKDAFCGTSSYSRLVGDTASGAYGIDFEFLLNDHEKFFEPFDENGLPMARFARAGNVYLPTRLAAYGLAHYNRYVLRGEQLSLEKALKTGEWFMSHDDGLWYYNFDLGELTAPWLCAMAQGEGISLLLRLNQATGETRYLDQSLRALAPLTQTLEQGGLRSRIDGQHDFLEEYPVKVPEHTLNGFMYCLTGLIEFNEVNPSVERIVGLPSLIETLRSQIGRWDIGYWTTYDLHQTSSRRRNAATATYHRLHTTQTALLGRLTGIAEFTQVSAKWDKYYHSLFRRVRALGAKIAYRLENPAGAK